MSSRAAGGKGWFAGWGQTEQGLHRRDLAVVEELAGGSELKVW